MHVSEKLAVLNELRRNKDNYLPLTDHAWKVFPKCTDDGDVNIGWDVGILDGKRPYFCEAWASGFTVLTYFISTKGIEDYTVEQLEDLLKENGIVWYVGERIYKMSLARFTEGSGNEFFSINIIVGDDDGVYIDGGIIFSLSRLNEYNS